MWYRDLLLGAIRIVSRTRSGRYLNFYPAWRGQTREVRIPILGGLGAGNTQSAEPWLPAIMHKLLLAKDGAFVDVGVNLGQTLIAFLSLGLDRQYVGFEPNPRCVYYAEYVARCNGAHRVTIVPCGLSDRYDVVSLFGNGDTDSAASVINGFRSRAEYATSAPVCIAPGDDVMRNFALDNISVLKIDVEGGELEVLRGLAGVVSRSRPFIVCEVLPVYDPTTANGSFRRRRLDGLLEFLQCHDYVIYRILHDGRVVSIGTIENHGDMTLVDHLFAPREMAEWLDANLCA